MQHEHRGDRALGVAGSASVPTMSYPSEGIETGVSVAAISSAAAAATGATDNSAITSVRPW